MSSAQALLSGIAVRGRSRVAIALLGSTLSLLAVAAWSRTYADGLGVRIAGWLIAAVPTPLPPPDQQASDELDEQAPFATAESVRGLSLDAKRPHAARARVAAQPGIRVSSAQVLALAARRAMPSAVFVKANGQRPAGLRLSGVSALGIGMQDGDVLTEAAGQKASSVAAVVAVVLAARARQVSEIGGRFYRGGIPFSLTVEQPYLKDPVPG